MRFSTSAATLLSLAASTQAAPQPWAGGNGAYQSSVFYVNWAIYARKHFVTDLPVDRLTKVNYAFANVNNVTGEVILSDVWADTQFPYPGDVAATNGTQLLGNFNQFYKLKQKNRNLKVTLSVGGWGFRANFKPALATEAGRQKFCDSSLTLIADLGLDGFDIDWEYPEDETDADNLVDTVKRCRQTYDAYSAKYANNYHFELSISAPAGPSRYNVYKVGEMDPYVDNWNLMAFDYQGPGFSNFTGHLSQVFPSKSNPKTTDGWDVTLNKFVPFNTEQAIQYYKSNVASPCKIQLGMPLYGRSFGQVIDLSKDHKGMGQKFNGSGAGSWEPGTLDYKDLPLNGSVVYHDDQVIGSWSWDKAKKELVSYDTPKVAAAKAQYLKRQGLGGAWWWDSSSDRTDDKSLTRTVVNELGGSRNLKRSQNNLFYPISKYDNIRNATAPH